jgi:tRNA(fMet)-specific endonuclease VapC
MYLLDTNILSYFFRGQGGVAERVHAHPSKLIYVPSVVILELEYGLYSSSKPEKHRAQIEWVKRTFQTVDLNTDAAQAAGHIRHVLEKAGKTIGTYDLLIAGIALANRFILVSRNTREFERVPGLRLENWYAE